jgi:hypothetical protein
VTKKKITTLDIEKILREGKEVIFQEERSKHEFLKKFNELIAESKKANESK